MELTKEWAAGGCGESVNWERWEGLGLLQGRWDSLGTSQVSYFMAPLSSPEPEVVPDAPF